MPPSPLPLSPQQSNSLRIFETHWFAPRSQSRLAIAKYHELSVIGPQYAVWLGLAVTFASAILVLWNVLHGFKILRKNANIRSVWFWVVDIPGVMLYLLFTVSVWGAVAKLQANQLQFVTKQPPVITSLAPSNP